MWPEKDWTGHEEKCGVCCHLQAVGMKPHDKHVHPMPFTPACPCCHSGQGWGTTGARGSGTRWEVYLGELCLSSCTKCGKAEAVCDHQPWYSFAAALRTVLNLLVFSFEAAALIPLAKLLSSLELLSSQIPNRIGEFGIEGFCSFSKLLRRFD